MAEILSLSEAVAGLMPLCWVSFLNPTYNLTHQIKIDRVLA